MRYKKLIFKCLWIAIVSVVVSCNGGNTEETSSTITTNQSLPSATTTDTTKSVWNNVNTAPLPSLPSTRPANASASVAGLNPAHGQPNHRCDIPVGASLNTPIQPVQQAQPPMQSLPSPGVQGSAKLNPAHGQPGHDCSIPVGQPLKNV